ncbi:uncharacterized protein CCOS01_15767, partial [Colletotrichum costaricense]
QSIQGSSTKTAFTTQAIINSSSNTESAFVSFVAPTINRYKGNVCGGFEIHLYERMTGKQSRARQPKHCPKSRSKINAYK